MSQKKGQQGFSLIELLIVVAIIGIIAAIAIPNLLASRRSANDAAAIGTLRTIHAAQATYQSTYGGGNNFAASGTDLAASGVDLIDDSISANGANKSGFTFTITGTELSGATPASYFAIAVPQTVGGVTATGTRSFCVTEDGVVHFDATGAAATNGADCRTKSALGQQ